MAFQRKKTYGDRRQGADPGFNEPVADKQQ
jgi:hypothetical protein